MATASSGDCTAISICSKSVPQKLLRVPSPASWLRFRSSSTVCTFRCGSRHSLHLGLLATLSQHPLSQCNSCPLKSRNPRRVHRRWRREKVYLSVCVRFTLRSSRKHRLGSLTHDRRSAPPPSSSPALRCSSTACTFRSGAQLLLCGREHLSFAEDSLGAACRSTLRSEVFRLNASSNVAVLKRFRRELVFGAERFAIARL